MTINWHHVLVYLISTIGFNSGFLILMGFTFKVLRKQNIEEITIGMPKLFVFYVSNIKVILGVTLFLVVGLKPLLSDDEAVRDKQIDDNLLVKLFIDGVLFIILFILSDLSLKGLVNYLFYFLFLLNFSGLRASLPEFTPIILLLGISTLALTASFLETVIKQLTTKFSKKFIKIYSIFGLVCVLLYCRLIWNYISG